MATATTISSAFLTSSTNYELMQTNEQEPEATIAEIPCKLAASMTEDILDYDSVLHQYPAYRAYLASYFCQTLGDSIVQITNVWVVKELLVEMADGGAWEERSSSIIPSLSVALSTLTLAYILPNMTFSLLGGILADKLDRRILMIATDIAAGTVVLGYLLAIRAESLSLIYSVTALRSAFSATRYPSAMGILPDLLLGTEDGNRSQRQNRKLQLAVTLMAWVRGASFVFAGVLAVIVGSVAGMEGWYLFDSFTYFLSATLIAKGVGGYHNLSVARENHDEHMNKDSSRYATSNIHVDEAEAIVGGDGNSSENDILPGTDFDARSSVLRYLAICGFGLMVLLKPSASFLSESNISFGADTSFTDVFRVNRQSDTIVEFNISLSDWGQTVKLVVAVFLGCVFGPLLLNTFSFTDARKPYTLQRACYIGIVLLNFGFLEVNFTKTFSARLMGFFFRTMGSSIVWTYSFLVLQTLCNPKYLGRVLALEYALTMLFEAANYFLKGSIITVVGLSGHQLALVGAGLGLGFELFWGVYHSLSLGAARPKFNDSKENVNIDDMTVDKDLA